MAELNTIARPYAKAAFELAVEKHAVQAWHEMLFFAGEVVKNPQVANVINGSSSPAKSADLVVQICGDQLNEYGQNLVKLMAENGRLPALPAVAELFGEFRRAHENEIEVAVTSATELSDSQRQSLVVSLEKRLARKVKLNCSVDASLVGGMIIHAGDEVIDGSIRGKLDRLSLALQS